MSAQEFSENYSEAENEPVRVIGQEDNMYDIPEEIESSEWDQGFESPTSLKAFFRWILITFPGGALQAAFLYTLSNFSHDVASAFIPALCLTQIAPYDKLLWTLGVFILGSFLISSRLPRYAVWRGGAAFLILIACDAFYYTQTLEPFRIFPWDDCRIEPVIGISIMGAAACAVAGGFGIRLGESLDDFIRDEMEEFFESIGWIPGDGK